MVGLPLVLFDRIFNSTTHQRFLPPSSAAPHSHTFKMVMPISFLDWLDTHRTLKGYKDPESSEASSGAQTPTSKDAPHGKSGAGKTEKVNGHGQDPAAGKATGCE